MFKKSISIKLTVGFVIMMLISMLTVGIIFINMFKQYTFKSRENLMLERARAISEVISENTMSNGQMRGFGGFIQFLDTLTEAKVWITDNKGAPAVFYGMGMGMMPEHSFSSEPLPKESEKVMETVLSGRESVSQSFSSLYREAALTIGTPVKDANGQIIGAVLLHSPVTGITEALDKAISILVVSLLISLALAAAMGVFYSLLFTRPLKAMNNSAQEMARGNYTTRTGISRKDELGQLGESLDILAGSLSHTIDELYQEKSKISDIISSISEGIAAFDLNLELLNMNNALPVLMSRPVPYSDELLRQDFYQLEIVEEINEVISKRMASQVLKEWLGKKLKFILSPISNKKGEITGCAVLVQDISESERLEQLRRDFVANVSHEFRTPLTVIKGSLEALIDGALEDSEDVNRFHKRMLSETRSLERLVGDLLELSRLQAGKITINKEKIHIPSLLSDTIRSMQTIADRKDIKILFAPSVDSPAVMGDYDRLRQLFIIFLDNALKYSPEKTTVNVEIFSGEKVTVVIRDEGYGISEEELPYIWDRFYKADKSRGSSGTGLGLAIAKHLVEIHGGEVAVESKLCKGTTVKIQLPKC